MNIELRDLVENMIGNKLDNSKIIFEILKKSVLCPNGEGLKAIGTLSSDGPVLAHCAGEESVRQVRRGHRFDPVGFSQYRPSFRLHLVC